MTLSAYSPGREAPSGPLPWLAGVPDELIATTTSVSYTHLTLPTKRIV